MGLSSRELWIFYRLLSDFASQAVLVIKPLVYLMDGILGLLAIRLLFYLLRRLIFAEEKSKKAIHVAIVLVLGVYFASEIAGGPFLTSTCLVDSAESMGYSPYDRS